MELSSYLYHNGGQFSGNRGGQRDYCRLCVNQLHDSKFTVSIKDEICVVENSLTALKLHLVIYIEKK